MSGRPIKRTLRGQVALIQTLSGRVGRDRIGAWLRDPSQSCPPSRPDGVVRLRKRPTTCRTALRSSNRLSR